jgi:hypothetical protein
MMAKGTGTRLKTWCLPRDTIQSAMDLVDSDRIKKCTMNLVGNSQSHQQSKERHKSDLYTALNDAALPFQVHSTEHARIRL